MNHEEMTTGSLSAEFPTPDLPEKLQQMILNLNTTREFSISTMTWGVLKAHILFGFGSSSGVGRGRECPLSVWGYFD